MRTVVFVIGATNCLAGDTLIDLNRGGKSFRAKLSHVVDMLSGVKVKGMKPWRASIPTRVRTRDSDGFLVLTDVESVTCAGYKTTYTLQCASGYSIRATADHRFLTTTGWKRLRNLQAGDQVYVDGGVARRVVKTPRLYHATYGMKNHPHRAAHRDSRGNGCVGYSVQTHRLIYEAFINGLPFDEYVRALRAGRAAGFQYVDPVTHTVHHKNGVLTDNRLDNLELVGAVEHQAAHGKVNWRNVTAQTTLETVARITKHGEELTYDIGVSHPSHSFVANGFVVHNSGKTTLMDAVKKTPNWGTVEVGRMLRAKYPPEFFAGQAAPKHTAVEAWQMCIGGVRDQIVIHGKEVVFVDGQPRDLEQLEKCMHFNDHLQSPVPVKTIFLSLFAARDLREARAKARDQHDPSKLALSMARLDGDVPMNYEILSRLLADKHNVIVVDTGVVRADEAPLWIDLKP